VYVGDLTELFRAMAGALRPGGRVAVSCELHDGEGRELRASGRWAHSRGELAQTAAAAGLELELFERPLRRETGQALTGLYGVTPP
jgi:predicted TPR repeat methyltransferase